MKRSILCALLVLGASQAFAGLEVQGQAVKSTSAKKKSTKNKVTPTSKVTVETYPAIEDMTYDDEPVVEIGTKPVQIESPSIVELDAVSKAKAMEERIALLEKKLGESTANVKVTSPAPAAPVASTQASNRVVTKADAVTTSASSTVAPKASSEKPYFSVAPDRREQIIARLKVIEALIRESGRAYDYRGMTNAQLNVELKSVRALAPKAPAKAAPQPSEDSSKTPGDVLKIIFSE